MSAKQEIQNLNNRIDK
ncbi:hypothetical protein, partial [Vibrio rarus]